MRPGVLDAIAAHCLRTYPLEACGLLLGAKDEVWEAYCGRNEAHSARVFTMAPADVLGAERRAKELGIQVVGVFHSHTHSEAFPSPTDVRQALDEAWAYLVVSLSRPLVEVRAYRIVGGQVHEERLAEVAGA